MAFKPRTDDVREAPALALIHKLHEAGAEVIAFDPVAGQNALKASKVKFHLSETKESAVQNADALVIITEWQEFYNPDFDLLKAEMASPVVFDGRNVFHPDELNRRGFQYYCVGRQVLAKSEGVLT